MESSIGSALICLLSIAALSIEVQAKIPSYIHVCKRNDPKIDTCIINSINSLRPKLRQGVPEYDIPPMEPLTIDQIVISSGGPFRAIGSNVKVHGASDFQILSLKSDVENMEYQVQLRIPKLRFDALYDVNARVLLLPVKGKGPISGNATDIEGNAILKGHKYQQNGKTYVKFDKLDLKMKLKNYNVRLENLFNGDKALGEAVNAAVNENKRELITAFRPRAEQVVSSVVLDIANNITKHFTYEELFPEK